ncbi:MAG: response regulator, partial [Rhodospirillaceae bacterium]|nr:response regulator [Rhodospirillaceae bacterium]
NSRFLSWYGSNDMALLGRTAESLTDPKDQENLRALFSATTPRTIEFSLLCADDTVRFALISAAPLRMADGGASGHFAIITDVTDLRRASERLRESEARFRGIIENTPFGILTLDATGRILSANPAFRACVGEGFGEDETASFWLPDATPSVSEMMANLKRTPETRTIDGTSLLKRDSGYPGHARLVLSRMGDGFLMIVEDITDRLHMEDALRHASKLALLGEMSASLAHEISQPLNVIRLSAESALLSLEDGDTAAIRTKFETIGTQSDSLRETIDHMQGFSRRDAGPCRCFDIRHAVKSALCLLLPQCATLNITVHCHMPSEPLPVLGHARQAEQVLINVLRNAIDAIVERRALDTDKPDEITIRAGFISAHDGTRMVGLDITDTGTGIPPEDIPHLFNPFFTRKTEGAGTGLGLSISLGLISDMGGRIKAENHPEGGCLFHIVLPVCLEPLTEEAPTAISLTKPLPLHPPPAIPAMAILVVDDEPLATQEIAAFLRKSGHTVSTAASGNEARDLLSKTHIDILITDLQMPNGNGFQLIAEAATEYPHIGLIVVTGQPLRDRNALAKLENGVDAILRKPLSLRELAETLHALA